VDIEYAQLCVLQDAAVILSLSTAALSYRDPASAGTYRNRFCSVAR
jgi:hypothetical protein